MAQCTHCSIDIPKGGVLQDDGTTLCMACDKIVHGPAVVKQSIDARNITFCPKCSAVWNPDQTYCATCHWDVVSNKHIEVKVPKKYVRVSVDVAGVILAVLAVVGGYIGFDYYRSSKAKERADAMALQDKKIADEKRADDERLRLEKLRVEAAKVEMQRAEARRAEAEVTKAKFAESRARRETEQKLLKEDAARREQTDLAQARREETEAQAERERAEADAKRAERLSAVATKEQKISLCRNDLKVAEADLKTAIQTRDKLQPMVIGFKNRIEASQRASDEAVIAMRLVEKEARTGKVANTNSGLIKTEVRLREEFTALNDRVPVSAPENAYEEQASKIKLKYIAARKEIAAAGKQLDEITFNLQDANDSIRYNERKCADLKDQLKELGVDSPASPAIAAADAATPGATPPAAPGKGKAVKVFKMKDGTVVRAVSTVVSGDDITVKDENGKFKTISRKDIESEEGPAQ